MSTSGLLLHKAIVHTADPATGVCTVRIPALMGGQVVSVDTEGLPLENGVWGVPPIGSSVSVSSTEDMRMFSWVVSPRAAVEAVGPDPFPQYALDTDVAPINPHLTSIDATIAALTAQVNALSQALVNSAGNVEATVRTTAPAGYLMLDGSTINNGQTLFPLLWAAIPTAWKVGTSIVLPDARGRTIIGAGTGAGLTARSLSALIGAETHTLTSSESGMPAHTPTGSTGNTNVDGHQHSLPASTGIESATHSHGPGSLLQAVGAPSTWNFGNEISNGTSFVLFASATSIGTEDANHTHSIGGSTGTVGVASTNHSHGVTINGVPAQNAASAHNNMQPSIALNWIIKT